ncbi:MAG: rod shape-determining protein [Elusimicrobia bacterium]|jgi:rod shape-determining protein MreB|nr:rod shape-determining protein [Elusimicrobiota bacterium]
MLDSILGFFSNDMGIDLGTANVLVYVKGRGIVLREPSVVAINEDDGEILAVGMEAKRMLGRTPANITAVRPLKNGVIADFDTTERMIRYFIRKVHARKSLLHPRIVISIPSACTEVERRAVKESAERAGAREVYVIEEPMAAAIGAELPVHEPAGNLVVDIGGGTTEVAVISLGGMVLTNAIRIAGDDFDRAIIEYFKEKENLTIGERTAEEAKIKIGSVYSGTEAKEMEIKGRDLVTGLPKTVTITTDDIRESLDEPMKELLKVIKETLNETPAELSADLVDRGIILVGGGALLGGIAQLLRDATELPVHIADEPMNCVVMGTGKYLEQMETLRKSQRRRLKYNIKNR